MSKRFLTATVLSLILIGSSAVGAQQQPTCPSDNQGRPEVLARATDDADFRGFVETFWSPPDTSLKFEVFESAGGLRIFGPVTKQIDAQNFNYTTLGPADGLEKLEVGNFVVVTGVETGTVKELDVAPLTIDAVDIAADTVSGTAAPGAQVCVRVPRPALGQPDAFAEATTGPSGSWTADFSAQGVDITKQAGLTTAEITDPDGDKTVGYPDSGCPHVHGGGCTISVGVDVDWIGGTFTPNSEVALEVFDSRGGRSLYGPVTKTTNETGSFPFIFLAFKEGIDLVPGTYVVMTDRATSTVKAQEIMPISIDRVDPDNDVIEGRAPPGEVVLLQTRDQAWGGPRSQEFIRLTHEFVADSAGNWRADYAGSFDITFEDAFAAWVFDDDDDVTVSELGAPIPGCLDDADTTCGSAGPDTIRESDGEVISGLGRDTLLISADDPSDSVRIVAGSGSDGIVLPAHAGGLDVSVFGGAGADRMITRAFGGGGASSGSYFLDGGGGDDSMQGGDGDDTLHGGDGANDFNGGPGIDTCLSDTRRDEFQGCERIRRNHRRNHQQA